MSELAAWLNRPTHKNGLDNIGTQQPCVLIYSHLLPGITNVTDRAIYFGFYVWFIKSYEARNPKSPDAEFRAELRKADCLLTLIAQRHSIASGDPDDGAHGAACPGSQKLGPAAAGVVAGQPITLSQYAAATDDNPNRYFKNPLGGLGQYYLGVLRDEMLVLQGDARNGLKYTNEIGGLIASDFADGLDEEQFFQVLGADEVSVEALDQLASFCPCSIANGHRPTIQNQLIRLVFGEIPCQRDAAQRRASLALILRFLNDHGGKPTDDTVKSFLSSCYCRSLDGETPWQLPKSMEPTSRFWGLYLRNEMLSLAWLALFKTALDAFDGLPKAIYNVREAAEWLLEREEFSFRPTAAFDQFIEECRTNLPPLSSYRDSHHEVSLWLSIIKRDNDPVAAAVHLMANLLVRHGTSKGSYVDLELSADALAGYPLTLDTLATSAQKWKGLSPYNWMRALVIEVLSAHQRVAIRKLGQSGEDTLMFRAGEDGLFVDRRLERVPETQPRLRQTFQILRDLGLTAVSGGATLPQLTGLGSARLALMEV